MPITPGITQAASLLNNLFRQGADPAQAVQALTDPEAIVSPADPYQRAGYDPVLEEVATVGVSGTDAPPPVYIEAVWNNICPEISTSWGVTSSTYISAAFSNNRAVITYKAVTSTINQGTVKSSSKQYAITQNHKYYVSFFVNAELAAGYKVLLYSTASARQTANKNVPANADYHYHVIHSYTGSSASGTVGVIYLPAITGMTENHIGKTATIWSPLIIDLTKMFGAGKEPSLSDFEAQCVLNDIDLTAPQAYNKDGTAVQWRIE